MLDTVFSLMNPSKSANLILKKLLSFDPSEGSTNQDAAVFDRTFIKEVLRSLPEETLQGLNSSRFHELHFSNRLSHVVDPMQILGRVFKVILNQSEHAEYEPIRIMKTHLSELF